MRTNLNFGKMEVQRYTASSTNSLSVVGNNNYRGLKLIDKVMKILECVVEGFIRQRVVINDMQCGFMQGRGTTDAIFILHQLKEKHLVAGKPLYLAFIDLEKAFDSATRSDLVEYAKIKS